MLPPSLVTVWQSELSCPGIVSTSTSVQDWRFDPLRIVTWKGSGADRVLVSTRTLPYSLEYRFTFSIVDGKGTASSGRSR